MLIRVLCFLALLPWLVNCASLRDTKQPVSFPCSSPRCEVEILKDGHKFSAPSIQKIERQKSLDIQYSNGKEKIDQTLEGHIRWADSVVANSLFLILPGIGPFLTAGGLATDYFTDNIWELSNPVKPEFKDNAKKIDFQKIVIAPTKAKNLNLSELILPHLKSFAQKFNAKAIVESYEQYPEEFANANWDYDSIPKYKWMLMDLYRAIETPLILVSQITHVSGQDYQIRLQLHDTVNDTLVHEETLTVQIEQKELSFAARASAFIREVMPNAISLSSVSLTSTGAMSPLNQNYTYYLNNTASPGEEERQSTNSVAFSLTNMEPQMGRRFDLVFKWRTDVSFYKLENKVVKSTPTFNMATFAINYNEERSAEVTSYIVAPGFGPEVGLVGPLGYIYLNYMVLANVSYSTYSTPTRSGDYTQIEMPMQMNVGYIIRLTENAQIGISAGIKFKDPTNADRLYGEVLGEDVKTSYNNETVGTFYWNYYIPWMQKKGRSIVNDL